MQFERLDLARLLGQLLRGGGGQRLARADARLDVGHRARELRARGGAERGARVGARGAAGELVRAVAAVADAVVDVRRKQVLPAVAGVGAEELAVFARRCACAFRIS